MILPRYDGHLVKSNNTLRGELWEREENIAETISALPKDIRHWTQLLRDGWMKNTILFFMPRLEHAY
jgi:hypothetical protein